MPPEPSHPVPKYCNHWNLPTRSSETIQYISLASPRYFKRRSTAAASSDAEKMKPRSLILVFSPGLQSLSGQWAPSAMTRFPEKPAIWCPGSHHVPTTASALVESRSHVSAASQLPSRDSLLDATANCDPCEIATEAAKSIVPATSAFGR